MNQERATLLPPAFQPKPPDSFELWLRSARPELRERVLAGRERQAEMARNRTRWGHK